MGSAPIGRAGCGGEVALLLDVATPIGSQQALSPVVLGAAAARSKMHDWPC